MTAAGASDRAGRAEPLPVTRAGSLPAEPERPRWLVDGMWSAEGVGLIGGAPKCCKTWLALDLAVSVASGTDALGRFPVVTPGPVLLYGAEDGPLQLRERIEQIAEARGQLLDGLDVHLILAPSLRLDTASDRARLCATVEQHQPRLLILDPLVRLHHIDENSAAEMSALLGHLRVLQRSHGLAIILVHHLRKNAAPRGHDGQSLRGSGDLHAWGDSNLYLRRRDRHLRLAIEHRAAPSPEPCRLELVTEPTAHLEVVDGDDAPQPRAAIDLAERIVQTLAAAAGAISRDDLRTVLRTRNSTLGEALVRLRSEGRIERHAGGFRLRADHSQIVPVPNPTEARERNGNGQGAQTVLRFEEPPGARAAHDDSPPGTG